MADLHVPIETVENGRITRRTFIKGVGWISNALGLLHKLGFVSKRTRVIEVRDLTGLKRYSVEEC